MEFRPIKIEKSLSRSNISDEIYSMIHLIRPEWNCSNTRLITFTEGITNTIYGLFNSDDDRDGLVIKLFGNHTELFIDRQSELDSMIRLSKSGALSQRVLVQFENGIIYEYAPGQSCSREDMRDENISQLIAQKLAQFHSVPIENEEKPFLIILLRKFLQLLNQYEEEKKNVLFYGEDVDLIERSILKDLLPNAKIGEDLVLCHNDLLVKNLIYDQKTNQISIIDFEYTHLNFALFDIANHFVEYAGVDNADFSIYPTRDEQKRWLKTYFQTRQMSNQLIDENLCHLIDRFSALAHLMWGLWALVQSHLSQLDFDYLHYAQIRLESYQRLKTILFENFHQ